MLRSLVPEHALPGFHRHLPRPGEEPADEVEDGSEDRCQEVAHALEDGREGVPAPGVESVQKRQQPAGQKRIGDEPHADEDERVGEEVRQQRHDTTEGNGEPVSQRLRREHESTEPDASAQRPGSAEQLQTRLDDVATAGDVHDRRTSRYAQIGENGMTARESVQQHVQAEADGCSRTQVGDVQNELVVGTLIPIGVVVDLLAAVDEHVEALPDPLVHGVETVAQPLRQTREKGACAHESVGDVEEGEEQEEDRQRSNDASDDAAVVAVDEARLGVRDTGRDTNGCARAAADHEVAAFPVQAFAAHRVGEGERHDRSDGGSDDRQTDGAAQPPGSPGCERSDAEVGELLEEVPRAAVLLVVRRLEQGLQLLDHPVQELVAEEQDEARHHVRDQQSESHDGSDCSRGEAETEQRGDERRAAERETAAYRQAERVVLAVIEPLARHIREKQTDEHADGRTGGGADAAQHGSAVEEGLTVLQDVVAEPAGAADYARVRQNAESANHE